MLKGDEEHWGLTGDMSRELPGKGRFPHPRRPSQEMEAFIQAIQQIVQAGNPRGEPLDGKARLFPLPASLGCLREHLRQEVAGPLQAADGRGAKRRLDPQRFFFQQGRQRRGGIVVIEGLG